jgi:DNA ligase D-like protein (predicted 3'-phosphoesterase)
VTGTSTWFMAQAHALEQYRRKRDFGRTTEPRGGRRRTSRSRRRFVIQKHDATTLHYDFRLEADGVLKSWALPKGPSVDPQDKQLAIRTEDHPLEYADFEGVIPEGEYGAGPVLIWDAGSYRNLTERAGRPIAVEDAIERGHVAVWLDGEKLHGGFALTRMRRGQKEAWLLVKMRDEGADRRRKPVRSQPASVRSGRTIEEIAAEVG